MTNEQNPRFCKTITGWCFRNSLPIQFLGYVFFSLSPWIYMDLIHDLQDLIREKTVDVNMLFCWQRWSAGLQPLHPTLQRPKLEEGRCRELSVLGPKIPRLANYRETWNSKSRFRRDVSVQDHFMKRQVCLWMKLTVLMATLCCTGVNMTQQKATKRLILTGPNSKKTQWKDTLKVKKIIGRRLLPRNLTWNLKMMVSKRNLLFQGLLFRFHVKFQGCMPKRHDLSSGFRKSLVFQSYLLRFRLLGRNFWGNTVDASEIPFPTNWHVENPCK